LYTLHSYFSAVWEFRCNFQAIIYNSDVREHTHTCDGRGAVLFPFPFPFPVRWRCHYDFYYSQTRHKNCAETGV